MNSSDVEHMLGTPLSGWQKLDAEETAKSTSGSGVYVIRVLDGKPVGRLKGSSDIL